MNEVQPTRWERFKSHMERNKKVYILSGVGVLLGIAGGYTLAKAGEGSDDAYEIPVFETPDLDIADSDVGEVNVNSFNNTENYIHNYNGETHVHNTTYNYGGYQSKIVRNLNTSEIFESQKAAAESVGVSEQAMSRHLNGLADDIHGDVFERIGFGTV